MDRETLAERLHSVAEVAALLVILLTRNSLSDVPQVVQVMGFVLFAIGALIAVSAAVYLRGGLTPGAPESLITTGPYRFVRHPYYLGWTVGILGLAIGFKSLWGLGLTLALVLPLAIYHARVEEQGLVERFGADWREYADRTKSVIPLIY